MNTKHFLNASSPHDLLEREQLVHSVQLLPPGSQIVEVGTGEGGTALLLLEAGREWDVRVASVDRKHDPALRSSLAALGVECLRGEPALPQAYWSRDRRIDFLVVDASQNYAALEATWMAWREYLNPHAFVFFHGVSPDRIGPFLFVWETIFQKEIAAVRGAGALLGGRFAMPGPHQRPPLTPSGEELLMSLLRSDLQAWPYQWLGMQPAKPVRRAARVAGSRGLAAAATYALGLEEPTGDEELTLVVSEPADLLVQQLGMQGCRPEQVLSAAPLFREALATALFRDGDERFFALFPDELRGGVRTFLEGLEPQVREALACGGLAGRVRLLDLVDARRLYEVAESFAPGGAGIGLVGPGTAAGTVPPWQLGAVSTGAAPAPAAPNDPWAADPDLQTRRHRRAAPPAGGADPGSGIGSGAAMGGAPGSGSRTSAARWPASALGSGPTTPPPAPGVPPARGGASDRPGAPSPSPSPSPRPRPPWLPPADEEREEPPRRQPPPPPTPARPVGSGQPISEWARRSALGTRRK